VIANVDRLALSIDDFHCNMSEITLIVAVD